MSPELNRTRASDKWGLPSTMVGCLFVLAAVAGMFFKLASPATCLAFGVLGGILVQGESVLGFWRVLRKPKP